MNELDAIDETPLKQTSFKGKLVIKNNIAVFENSTSNNIISLFLRVLVFAFWGAVFYNIYHLNFIVFDEAPVLVSIPLTLLVFAIGVIFTFVSLMNRTAMKAEEYINKNTGEINLFGLDREVKPNLSDVVGLQSLSYVENRRVPNPMGISYDIEVTLFQINLIIKDNTRINVCLLSKEKKAIELAKRLSSFLNKKLFINLKATGKN